MSNNNKKNSAFTDYDRAMEKNKGKLNWAKKNVKLGGKWARIIFSIDTNPKFKKLSEQDFKKYKKWQDEKPNFKWD